MNSDEKKRFDNAVSKLADLIEFGHLIAATDPVTFMELLAEKVMSMKKKCGGVDDEVQRDD